jgi:hypothetical protein
MLELDNGEKIMEEIWEMTSTRVELPEALKQGFFEKRGPAPLSPKNQRQYHRYFMRGKAILKRGTTTIGTYTKDVSRQGVGFFSPVPLMPKERVKLRLPVAELGLEIARCRRIEPGCFECGGRFAL